LSGVVGCGAAKPQDARSSVSEAPSAPASTTPAKAVLPEPYEPGANLADVIGPFVRPERSSRLAVPLPKGKPRERWTFALDPKLDPAFVVATGTRIVVQGKPKVSATKRESRFVVLDTYGRRVGDDLLVGELVRLEPATGKLRGVGVSELPAAWRLADATLSNDELGRTVEGALASRGAFHEGVQVLLQSGRVEIYIPSSSPRGAGLQRTVVEPPVKPLDCAIDDDANLHIIVRQGTDLALWSTPLAGGSVGRIRLGPLQRDHSDVPPILGGAVRVIVLDDRIIAVARDGQKSWERKGALTGGATITSDDRLLVATDAKILTIDPSGRASELASAPGEIFLTPPILTGSGLLLVASGSMLHAYAFE